MSKVKKSTKKEKTISITIKEAKKLCDIIEGSIDWDGAVDEDDEKDIQEASDLLDEIKTRIKKGK